MKDFIILYVVGVFLSLAVLGLYSEYTKTHDATDRVTSYQEEAHLLRFEFTKKEEKEFREGNKNYTFFEMVVNAEDGSSTVYKFYTLEGFHDIVSKGIDCQKEEAKKISQEFVDERVLRIKEYEEYKNQMKTPLYDGAGGKTIPSPFYDEAGGKIIQIK